MLGAMLFISIHTAGSATFPVSNLNDSGVGSLRYAITNANAAVGTNTITFDAGVTGTITLTNGQLTINNHVNIIGPGPAALAVSGNDSNRVFRGTGQTVDWLIEVHPRQGAPPILRWRSRLGCRTDTHHHGGSQKEACRM
jgi:hypothetical protein